MKRFLKQGLAASIVAGALLVLPAVSNAAPGDVITVAGIPYQCVPVAGCATVVSWTPIVRTFVLKPYECVNSAGCATPYGW